MKLQILPQARDDLIEGFHFYEDKEEGLGDYFLACLYSDNEGLYRLSRASRSAGATKMNARPARLCSRNPNSDKPSRSARAVAYETAWRERCPAMS